MYDSNIYENKIEREVKKMTRQYKITIQTKINKDKYVSALKFDEKQEFKENDNISHFICRLAYCRDEKLRKWFITQETRLFSIRLGEL